ncbi:hypothetical protein ACLB2K_045133 [Fragaria x ananassa]
MAPKAEKKPAEKKPAEKTVAEKAPAEKKPKAGKKPKPKLQGWYHHAQKDKNFQKWVASNLDVAGIGRSFTTGGSSNLRALLRRAQYSIGCEAGMNTKRGVRAFQRYQSTPKSVVGWPSYGRKKFEVKMEMGERES